MRQGFALLTNSNYCIGNCAVCDECIFIVFMHISLVLNRAIV